MEVSRYHYLQKGHPWDKIMAAYIAINGTFEEFAKNAPFFGKPIFDAENYYTLNGEKLDNLLLLRFENLNEEIKENLNEYMDISLLPQCKVNATKRKSYAEYMTPLLGSYI